MTGRAPRTVAAIIPTLGGRVDRLRDTIAAVAAQDAEVRLSIVVVVNSPTPPAAELADAKVELVHAGANFGWAGGLALGRAVSEAELLWLVQDDLRPEPGCLTALIAALESGPELAVVAPLVVDEAGCVPRLSCGGSFGPDGDHERLIPELDTPVDEFVAPEWGDYIPSRGMLVHRDDWDALGGMDPRYYPVLWADVDFCARLTARGRRFAISMSARAAHEGNGSLPGGLGPFLHARNRDLFLARHRPEIARPVDATRPSAPGSLTGVLHPGASPQLIATLLQASADAFLHLSRRRANEGPSSAELATQLAARLADEQQRSAELAAELAELRASSSWRLTAPLRRVAAAIRRPAR